jgi:uncharacterized membrane protein
MIIVLLLIGILTGLFASKKGYLFIAWFFAGGLIGLIALACLPDAYEVKTPMEPWEVRRFQRQGNIIGAIISVCSIIIGILIAHNRMSNH